VNKGLKRLVLVISLLAGILAIIVSEAHITYSKFLESKALNVAWQNEFPNRDPAYHSTSETPKWEESVEISKYEKELSNLVEASADERFRLKAEYHVTYGMLPFLGAVAILWCLAIAIGWIINGYKKNS